MKTQDYYSATEYGMADLDGQRDTTAGEANAPSAPFDARLDASSDVTVLFKSDISIARP